MKKIFAVLLGVSLLLTACQKAEKPLEKTVAPIEATAQNGNGSSNTPNKAESISGEKVAENKEVELKKNAQSELKAEDISKLPPLERAKGKEVKGYDGLPIITWGSLKDLPTLDETLPTVDKLPSGIESPKPLVEPITLPETEERKRLRKNVKDEFIDKLQAIKSKTGCVLEIYGGTLPNKKREDWLRSIDPQTNKVLWKQDEPGLVAPDAAVDFPEETDFFLLTNIAHNESVAPSVVGTVGMNHWIVKLFSCKTGFIKDIYMSEFEGPAPHSMGNITSDGKNAIIHTKEGKIIKFRLPDGEIAWDKQIDPYKKGLHPPSIYDDKYIATHYSSSLLEYVDEQRRAGLPSELILLDIKTGETLWKKRWRADLGDKSMITNTMEIHGITKDGIVGVWLLDGIGFVIKKTNPYGNAAVLFVKDNVLAFRIDSLGFRFSEDGRYLSANGKFYDISRVGGFSEM